MDENDDVWVGVHFGSRGLGHKIATYYLKESGGKDGMNVPAAVIGVDTDLGGRYVAAMKLAGRYAYAGRDWVCRQGGGRSSEPDIKAEIHNHHNFAWLE